ncbi:hypothetical protein F5J12DRAFT_973769 [Pisolithus orientalis]|uniref:uncharacterized protein n=1 Tax=Pisolithus orientalis TaxID=936130 RepID=UPI0022243676|nr:uncharacterized protein F5J12DRAFT_973769 [Pisolithus orientalis]KAI5986306.1 hypothetical protein F5J12DRAFT_973769 [Pisolithus orientalis]
MQLANAIIHDKANKVNEGCSHGEKLSLQQIQELARVDPKYQDMTKDEKDELLHGLTEYHTLKNTSVHTTNSAAACDAPLTLEHVFKIPFWYRTDNVMDFWEDVMDLCCSCALTLARLGLTLVQSSLGLSKLLPLVGLAHNLVRLALLISVL